VHKCKQQLKCIKTKTFHLKFNFSLKGGIYVLNLVDTAVGGYPLIIVGLSQSIVVPWIYGKNHQIKLLLLLLDLYF
jgi:SNF family Na+-dependent transporter